MVRISLDGAEYALRISGHLSEHFVKALVATLNQQSKTAGEKRVKNLLKSKEPLKIYQVAQENIKEISKEAKRFGLTYTLVKGGADETGKRDILVRKVDAPKFDRIIDKLNARVIDVDATMDDIERARAGRVDKDTPDKPAAAKAQEAIADFIGIPDKAEEPNPQKALQTRSNLSEPTSRESKGSDAISDDGRAQIPSVLKEIEKLKAEREKTKEPAVKEQAKAKQQSQTKHIQPQPGKVRKPKSKER
jgi:hypothetical protein